MALSQRIHESGLNLLGWKHDRQSEIPSWTSTPDASTQPPFTSLLGLLESPPQISNVAFRFPIAHVNLHPIVTPTDIFTFYIPVYVIDEQLATFNQVIRNFHSAFAHVSHEPSLEMLSAQSGWGLRVVDRGGKGVKMMVFVSLHTWTSKDNELAYKNGGEYERLFLKPLLGAEAFGVEWDEEQVVFERVGLWVPIVLHSGRRGILEILKGLAALTTRVF